MEIKETNPKDSVGIKKAPLHMVPPAVMFEIGLGLAEGARKYGSYNFRSAGVRASVYYDALMRHMCQWWEGEDIDNDSNLSHVTKALSCLTVLRDAMMNNMWNDDRPIKHKNQEWLRENNKKMEQLLNKYPKGVDPFTELDNK